MTRLSQLTLAALFAALIAVVGMAPAARAASIPAGAAMQVELNGGAQGAEVRYGGRRGGGFRGGGFRGGYGVRRGYGFRGYGYRRAYVAPVYYGRRCWTRPRMVWTPYGYVRRWVRVCRY